MRPALTTGRRAVVTAKAVTAKVGMVDDRYRGPRTDVVTGVAFGARLNMAIAFARRSNTIVTA